MSDKHICCEGHCCVIHGCKYGMDDCPVALGEVVQRHPCEECGLEKEGYFGVLPEMEGAPFGCPRCSSTRIVFDSKYDIPEGQKPAVGDPIRKFVLCLACKYEGPWSEFNGHKERLVKELPMEPAPDVPAADLDMGVVAEGKLDLFGGEYLIEGERDGKPYTWHLGEALNKYIGQEVRVIIVTFDTINKVAKLVEAGGMSIEDAVVGGRSGVE